MSISHVAKHFWKEAFAEASIFEARTYLQRMEDTLASKETRLYESFWVLFVISYCRPFTQACGGVGKISAKVIPKELARLHSSLMIARNTMLGHTDPDERAGDGNQVNRLRLRVKDGKLVTTPVRLCPSPELLERLRDLCEVVYENVRVLRRELIQQIPEVRDLEDGSYLFDFKLPEGRMCIPQKHGTDPSSEISNPS